MLQRRLLIASLCLPALAAAVGESRAGAQPAWRSVQPMSAPRADHQAVLLSDGRVLVLGGVSADTASAAINSAEVYVPERNAWVPMPAMNASRTEFTAVRMADGRVLAAGGRGSLGVAQASAELFDPADGTWTPVRDMTLARTGHTAVVMSDGRVLVAGGEDDGGHISATTEVFDPAAGTWTRAGSMGVAREGDAMTVLADGRVLISGGHSDYYMAHATAEIFDPALGPAGGWVPTGTMSEARNYHISALLPGGEVLVSGGEDQWGLVGPTAEIWNPSTGAWRPAAPMFVPRNYHSALVLANGSILVSGGGTLATGSGALRSAEMYDPASGTWRRVRSMENRRQTHAAVLLNGRREALVFGGYDTADVAQTSSERFVLVSPEESSRP